MSTPVSALEQALALTQAMLAAAQSANWTQLVELEIERQPLLASPYPNDAESIRLLGEILAHNRALADLIGQARDAAADQWQLESGRAQAIAAYAG